MIYDAAAIRRARKSVANKVARPSWSFRPLSHQTTDSRNRRAGLLSKRFHHSFFPTDPASNGRAFLLGAMVRPHFHGLPPEAILSL